jgi:hypothetical protein
MPPPAWEPRRETKLPDLITIPARRGKAPFVNEGQTIKVINGRAGKPVEAHFVVDG